MRRNQILMFKPTDDPAYEFVMVYVREKEYATYLHNKPTGTFHWGHYFTDLTKAVKDFDAR